MALRGRPETGKPGVGVDGDPVRYQWGAYVSMQNQWSALRAVKPGGTAEAKAFVPVIGTKAFFIFILNFTRSDSNGKGSPTDCI